MASAAEIFFNKQVKDLNLSEMAVLAGSLTAPSIYNIVTNPQKAKLRQKYVLKRMEETGRIDESGLQMAVNETLVVNRKKKYKEVAPYFVETIRQLLVKELGEEMVLDKGLKIYSSLDFEAQKKHRPVSDRDFGSLTKDRDSGDPNKILILKTRSF